VKLKELMIDTKTAWVEFPGCEGFEVEVVNLARKELLALRKRCVKTKFNRTTHQAEEELDENKFIHEFTKATINNWKGFKLRYLEELLLVDLQNNDPDTELEYNQENAEELIQNSADFDTWVNEVIFDLANFRGGSEGTTVGKNRKVAKES